MFSIKGIPTILQYDTKFQDIKFKNNTTLKSYGCCVMSMSMIIAYMLKATPDKFRQIVKDVVLNGTNENGDVTYLPMVVLGQKFKCTMAPDAFACVQKGIPAILRVKKNSFSHYVVFNEAEAGAKFQDYKIIDSGFGQKTLGGLLKFAKAENDVTAITKKFIIEKVV
jgi:hypothetical protein